MPDTHEIKPIGRQMDDMRAILRRLRDGLIADQAYHEAAALCVIIADDERVMRLVSLVAPKNR